MSNIDLLAEIKDGKDAATMVSHCCLVAEKKEEESKILFEKEESQKRNVHLSPRKRYPLSSLPVKKRYKEYFDDHNFNTPESEKEIDPPNLTAVQSSSPSSSTSRKRLNVKQKKITDGFNKAKDDLLPMEKGKTMMKDPPSSNDVESSSPSSFTSSKRLNVEQKKRKGVSRKPKIAPNPSVERKVPEWVYQVMRNINSDVENPKVIIEKTLSMSDVSPNQSRLLIPFKALINSDFLTPDEDRAMNKEENNDNVGVRTILVNERSKKWNLRFTKWSKKKKNCGKETFNYVLNSGWNDVVKSNNLKANDKMRLWTFRNNNGVLCFALELLV